MKQQSICIVLVNLFFVVNIQAQSNDWENQNVTQINKELPTATLFYDDSAPTLPRIGYTAKLPKNYDTITWYGKGPGSSYSDRKTGMKMGIYNASIDNLFTNYIKPQANGNRAEVRWFQVGIEDPFKVSSVQPIHFSLQKYEAKNVAKARFTYQLKEGKYNILNIDLEHGPVGNGSCGPIPLTKYLVAPKTKQYQFKIQF